MSKQNPGIDSNHELLTLDLITPLTSQTFSESETEEIQFLPCNIQADECPSSRKSTSPRKDKRDTLKSVRGSEQKKHKRVKIQSC